MSDYDHEFEAPLVQHDFGRVCYAVVFVPPEIITCLQFGRSKRLRIDGEVNGVRIEAALIPSKGQWYVMVSKRLQKTCGIRVGDSVTVSFDIADPNAVNIPPELQFALDANDEARMEWEQLSAGKKRSHCYWVDSAKMPETRERRVNKTIDRIITPPEG
ncbi:MAG: YdeI/OmpD-associated family protein [Planctomycetota bacterium]